MVIQVGEKVHIISRRLFEEDLRRHFAGQVTAVSESMMRLKGYVFVFDESLNDFVRQADLRERLSGIADAGLVINLLPSNADLALVRYATNDKGQRILTDGETFTLDISEFGPRR